MTDLQQKAVLQPRIRLLSPLLSSLWYFPSPGTTPPPGFGERHSPHLARYNPKASRLPSSPRCVLLFPHPLLLSLKLKKLLPKNYNKEDKSILRSRGCLSPNVGAGCVRALEPTRARPLVRSRQGRNTAAVRERPFCAQLTWQPTSCTCHPPSRLFTRHCALRADTFIFLKNPLFKYIH